MKRNKKLHTKSYIQLGKNIRNYRKLKKYSQEELAFSVSSARNYIGCIERGEKIPSISILLDIARELDCSIQDLFFKV